MVALTYQFGALETVAEEAHACFEPLLADQATPERASLLLHLQLAAHEWLANLVQHADFGGRSPRISLHIEELDSGHVVCVVEDNSNGFDLDEALRRRRANLSPLPERGMGLLILFACASELHYRRQADGNQLRFVVSDDQDKCLNIPF